MIWKAPGPRVRGPRDSLALELLDVAAQAFASAKAQGGDSEAQQRQRGWLWNRIDRGYGRRHAGGNVINAEDDAAIRHTRLAFQDRKCFSGRTKDQLK